MLPTTNKGNNFALSISFSIANLKEKLSLEDLRAYAVEKGEPKAISGQQELIENIKEFEKTLPMKRLGEPEEIGNFIKGIIENNVKYLTGVTINFDGANSNYIF